MLGTPSSAGRKQRGTRIISMTSTTVSQTSWQSTRSCWCMYLASKIWGLPVYNPTATLSSSTVSCFRSNSDYLADNERNPSRQPRRRQCNTGDYCHAHHANRSSAYGNSHASLLRQQQPYLLPVLATRFTTASLHYSQDANCADPKTPSLFVIAIDGAAYHSDQATVKAGSCLTLNFEQIPQWRRLLLTVQRARLPQRILYVPNLAMLIRQVPFMDVLRLMV